VQFATSDVIKLKQQKTSGFFKILKHLTKNYLIILGVLLHMYALVVLNNKRRHVIYLLHQKLFDKSFGSLEQKPAPLPTASLILQFVLDSLLRIFADTVFRKKKLSES
jgi:hypothetical protein